MVDGRRTAAAVAALAVAVVGGPRLVAGETLTLVKFPPDVAELYSARCLDGSPAGYYINEHPGSTGWAVYLEGGGLCVTSVDCRSRVKGNEGSSNKWGQTFSDTTNVLSGPENGNPFGQFSKVWVPYCSGDTWTGMNSKNRWLGGLQTNGHRIVTALFDHLYNTTSLPGAKQLLFTGGSAGGIGVWHNADYVSTRLQQLGMRTVVKASPQAGYFFPRNICNFETFAAGSRIPFDLFASAYANFLEGGYVNPACVAAEEKPQRCWDVGVVSKYVKTPMMVAQNAVDSNQVEDELLCPPGICSSHPKTKVARDFQADFANKTASSLQEYLVEHPTSAVFMPGCYDHTGDLCMSIGPTVNGITYKKMLGDWFFNNSFQGSFIHDSCAPDDVTCNPKCGSGCGDS